MLGWTALAEGRQQDALKECERVLTCRTKSASEVDIPAREMLADMLLKFHHPEQALVEYDLAIKLSPNCLMVCSTRVWPPKPQNLN